MRYPDRAGAGSAQTLIRSIRTRLVLLLGRQAPLVPLTQPELARRRLLSPRPAGTCVMRSMHDGSPGSKVTGKTVVAVIEALDAR